MFGNTTSCEEKVHNPFRYRGQQLDSITNQYYLRAKYYNPVIRRFTQEDTYHGDGLNLYAYCDNNPVKYYDPSGYSKVDANDNKKALQSLVDEINERGGATADERTILNGWADEYGVPKDSMGLESQKQLSGPTSSSGVEPRAKVPSSEGGSKTKINYRASNGLALEATPGKTTTVLGTYSSDTGAILDELGNVKSLDFGPRDGGFNLLNTPDELYVSPEQFWNEHNKPWLDNVIERNDIVKIATEPSFENLTRINKEKGKMELTRFGREYTYLRKNGYHYDAITKIMTK